MIPTTRQREVQGNYAQFKEELRDPEANEVDLHMQVLTQGTVEEDKEFMERKFFMSPRNFSIRAASKGWSCNFCVNNQK